MVRHIKNLVAGVFTFLGLIFLVVAVLVGVNGNKFYKTAQQTEAIITAWDQSNNGDMSYPIVSYTVDGMEYQSRLNYTSSSMYTGQVLTVYYQPDRPDIARAKGASQLILYIFGGMGGIFFLLGLMGLLLWNKNAGGKKSLRERGMRVSATFTGISRGSISVNGRVPYVVEGTYKDPQDGKVYTYRSAPIPYDPTPYLEGQASLPVYIQPGKPAVYFMDIQEIIPEAGNQ